LRQVDTSEINPDTGLFDPEYVNIFGVPFTFLPHESKEGAIPTLSLLVAFAIQ
jgi:hypothetical protein